MHGTKHAETRGHNRKIMSEAIIHPAGIRFGSVLVGAEPFWPTAPEPNFAPSVPGAIQRSTMVAWQSGLYPVSLYVAQSRSVQ